MYALSQNVIDNLIEIAKQEIPTDSGDDVYDSFGGNFDDAYSVGYDVGQTRLARSILDDLEISWK